MPSNSLNRGGSPEEPAGDPERLNNGQPARNSGQDSERLNIREELADIWDQDLLFMRVGHCIRHADHSVYPRAFYAH